MSCRDIILDSVLKGKREESLLSLSKHKYASNVVEKLIQFGLCQQRELIVSEMLKVSDLCQSNLITVRIIDSRLHSIFTRHMASQTIALQWRWQKMILQTT